MIRSVLDFLENTEEKYGQKLAYWDENNHITFSELKELSRKIGSFLAEKISKNQPVLTYMPKCVECIESFLGIIYAGGFYVPIDTDMPVARVQHIMNTCKSNIIIAKKGYEIPSEISENAEILFVEDMLKTSIEEEKLSEIRRHLIDADPIYAIFTSGSTGVPKGVLVSERSVINFTDWYTETFEFSENEVFANQTPFYFDASVKDIYATLKCGATMYIVPHKLFSLPKALIEFLNEHKVNAIDWVPSVLCMVVNFHTFRKVKPEYLKKVIFLGEVMPTKQFNIWKTELPDIKYANVYGPTEATSDCAYYKINREFSDDEPIPIGDACENTEIMLLSDDGHKIVKQGELGEICVRGVSLALGYYNDLEKTDSVFTQNPLQNAYHERIYHTGDLGKYNEYNEIVFVSRKDFQIKHMGHRIELGEIENAINAIDGVGRVACIYDDVKKKIIAVYEGECDKETLIKEAQKKIPQYMIPNIIYSVDSLPLNLNGKIDRVALKKEYIG